MRGISQFLILVIALIGGLAILSFFLWKGIYPGFRVSSEEECRQYCIERCQMFISGTINRITLLNARFTNCLQKYADEWGVANNCNSDSECITLCRKITGEGG